MAHTNIISARFWLYHAGDWARLALRDGESLELFEGGPTDEGNCAEWTTYTRDGDVITCEWSRSERDCDGQHSASGECETTIDDLTADPAESCDWGLDRPARPQWRAIDSRQRDYSAESAGY